MSSQLPIKIIPVIMSGGVGKRLWPLSREDFPKPYLKLYNSKSLLQNTILRCQQISFLTAPVIICNQINKAITLSQLKEINVDNYTLILEHDAHNTAPSVSIVAQYVQQIMGNALLLIMPIDHKIDSIEGFKRSIEHGMRFAEQGTMVIFGVKPISAHRGYGYIDVNEPTTEDVYQVKKFEEKPDQFHAEQFYADGHHFWNAGLYLVTVDRLIADFKRYQPSLFKECEHALSHAKQQNNIIELPKDAYVACPLLSLDYAITENANNINMVVLHSAWSDLGDWRSIFNINTKNIDENVLIGNAVAIDSNDSYIHTDPHQLTVAIGIHNCSVVETPDAILIADNNHLDQLPDILESLKKQHRKEILTPTTVFRPWGFYTILEAALNFQIKKIVVYPHEALSLQSHQFRSEHWVVIKGKATVTIGPSKNFVSPNHSVFVPVGVRHRLENNEEFPLEIIEIQTGTYFGEDDITRYEDKYDREAISVKAEILSDDE